MVMAVLFSAPIMLVCLLSDVCLGIINRISPQLNVFSVWRNPWHDC
jgi:type III secretion protein T